MLSLTEPNLTQLILWNTSSTLVSLPLQELPVKHHKNIISYSVGWPSTKPKHVAKSVALCSIYLSSYGPGRPHQCSRGSQLENLVRSSSNRTKEKVISSQFKEVFEDRNISTAGGTAKLATSGTPLQTTLGSVDPKQPAKKFSSGGLKIMKDVENFYEWNVAVAL